MNMHYFFQEMLAGIRQSKGSFIFSIFSVTFLLILIGFVTLVSANLEYFFKFIHEQMQIQAYLSNTLTEEQILKLKERILQLEYVDKIEYISKDVAAQTLQKEFGRELFNLIGENPLPSSFTIGLKEKYRNEQALQTAAAAIQKEAGIEEVVYQNQAILKFSRYLEVASRISLFLLAFLTLGSLVVIANNIRSVILARRHIIYTMQLVGATPTYIRVPLYLEGAFQGAVGGFFASCFLYGLVWILEQQMPMKVHGAPVQNFVLVFVGIGFGLLGSFWAIRRYL